METYRDFCEKMEIDQECENLRTGVDRYCTPKEEIALFGLFVVLSLPSIAVIAMLVWRAL